MANISSQSKERKRRKQRIGNEKKKNDNDNKDREVRESHLIEFSNIFVMHRIYKFSFEGENVSFIKISKHTFVDHTLSHINFKSNE